MMRKFFNKTKIFVALVLAIMLLSSSALAATYSAKVLSSKMRVYAKPSVSEKYLGSLERGDEFTVLAISGEWALVRKGTRIGYARLQDIIFDNAIRGEITKDTTLYYVTKESFKEGVYYKATAREGLKVSVVGIRDDYLLIINDDGSALGYVRASRVKKL